MEDKTNDLNEKIPKIDDNTLSEIVNKLEDIIKEIRKGRELRPFRVRITILILILGYIHK